jgi:OmpA-OmpF porin, OOP family
MKKVILLTCISLTILFEGNAQDTTFNKNSFEFNLGVNLAAKSFSPGYIPGKIGSYSGMIAYRHMFNNKFGIRFSGVVNQVKNASNPIYNSLPFSTKHFGMSSEMVLNMARILNFETFSSRLGLTFHTGFGVSSLKNENSSYFKWYTKNGADEMVHFVYGISPTFRLSSNLLINLDYSYYSFTSQNLNLDMKGPTTTTGFNGKLGTLTAGLVIRLGKNETHIDDCITDNKVDTMELSRRISQLEEDLKDDDADGVPNYLDLEKETPPGSSVNSKGQKIEEVKLVLDSDSDGIVDEFDKCPTEKGLFSNDGCPQKQMQTISTSSDSKLLFVFNSDKLTQEGKDYFTQLSKELKENKVENITLIGHTDSKGTDDYNLKLGRLRAEEIKKQLVLMGFNKARIKIESLGESKPIASNETKEGMAKNRRVEIVF